MSGSNPHNFVDWKTQGIRSHNEASQDLEALVRQLARFAAQKDYDLDQASINNHQTQQGTEE